MNAELIQSLATIATVYPHFAGPLRQAADELERLEKERQCLKSDLDCMRAAVDSARDRADALTTEKQRLAGIVEGVDGLLSKWGDIRIIKRNGRFSIEDPETQHPLSESLQSAIDAAKGE